MSEELDRLLAWAKDWAAKATPAQLAKMRSEQRESFIRAFAPCPHGMVDFEECPGCIAEGEAYRAAKGASIEQGGKR